MLTFDGDWPALRAALHDDHFLTEPQRADALAHADRLAPWFESPF